jgi:hypothetical protein
MTTVVHTVLTIPVKANDGGVTAVVEAPPLHYSSHKPLMLQPFEGFLIAGYIP